MLLARVGAALGLALGVAAAAAEPIEIAAHPLSLVPGRPGETRLGALVFRGGVELTSPDSRFGGLSGLVVSADGTWVTAITDTGSWIEMALTYDGEGRLAGVAEASVTALRDEAGRALRGKRDADAEALTALAGGGFLVAFERRHRLRRYAAPGANAEPALALADLARAPANGGIEALAALPRGGVLAIAEDLFAGEGRLAAWLIEGDAVHPLTWPGDGYFKPTAIAALADGRIFVLERGFTILGGVKARIMEMRGAPSAGAALSGRELARLAPPAQVDNYEGLAARTGMSGEVLLYIVSDDNFNPLQRTLLLMFALAE
jgi:YD repeat-containing protein